MEINGITFGQAFDRSIQLSFRANKVHMRWMIYSHFHPVKAIFVRKRFNKTLRRIHEARMDLYNSILMPTKEEVDNIKSFHI